MRNIGQTDMQGQSLPSEFQLGPLQFQNADSFPLEEMYCHVEEDEITLRLSASFPPDSPWRGNAMVVFFLYRFPGGHDEFDETVQRYRKKKGKSVKLPEKQPFDETILALTDVAGIWEHDCFAVASRNLFHVYRSGDMGVMIRWSSQKGTMLDHPLLSLVRDNVRLVEGEWETRVPETTAVNANDDSEDDDVDDGDDVDGDDELVTRLDLRIEQQHVREFIEARITEYAKRDNFGPGEPEDHIGLITLGYYAEQAGYVALVLDTRPDAEVDGEWTGFIEDELNVLNVPEWYGLYMAVYEELTVTLIAHDGTEHVIENNEIDDEELNTIFGEMLLATMQELRTDGTLAKLPLRPDAFFVVEEFGGRYFWPTYETLKTAGLIAGK